MADKAFKGHAARAHGPDRWLMFRQGTSMYSCEVALLYRSRVLVHGDIQAVLFEPTAAMELRSAISYIAEGHLDYISEKVTTGERWEWDPEVAAGEMQLALLDDQDALSALERSVLTEMSARLLGGESFTKENFFEDLARLGPHEWNFGRVVNADIIWAWRAVTKLDKLLRDASPFAVTSLPLAPETA